MTNAADGNATTDLPWENTPPPTDQVLVQRCLAGQSQAYRLLYRRHQAKVRSTLFQLCGQGALDDLVQEVFVRAWKGLPKFRQRSQFSTWLYRITWNVAYDYRQRQARQREQLQVLQQTVEVEVPAGDVMALHYQDLVQRGLAALSLDHRAVLVLHDLERLPQKEIAKILEISVGTVKSRLFYARSAMRKFLEQAGVQP